MTPEERVMDELLRAAQRPAVDKSRVIIVEFQSEDPDLAARVANAIVDAYHQHASRPPSRSRRAAPRQWLATEIEKLRPKVADAEAKVEDFRAKANLFVGTNNANLGQQQLAN